MNLLFDLDGVIRNLHFWCPDISSWNQKVNGLSFCGTIDRDMELLIDAPPTEYFDVIRTVDPLIIITHQPPYWRMNTRLWIRRHIPKATTIFTNTPEEKLCFVDRSTLLVEDNPNLPDYSQIILINRPYNQGVVGCYERVSSPVRLGEIINQYA